MSLTSDWKIHAVCASDPKPDAWMSYNKDDIIYAKSGCDRCTVRRECFFNAWNQEDFYGVYGGISEFEFLIGTWKEAKKESDVNWKRTDRILQRLLQKAS